MVSIQDCGSFGPSSNALLMQAHSAELNISAAALAGVPEWPNVRMKLSADNFQLKQARGAGLKRRLWKEGDKSPSNWRIFLSVLRRLGAPVTKIALIYPVA
jgi:hypothetical protein